MNRNFINYIQSVEFESNLDQFSSFLGMDLTNAVPYQQKWLHSKTRHVRIRAKLTFILAKCGYDVTQASLKGAAVGVFFKNPKMIILFSAAFGAVKSTEILMAAHQVFLAGPRWVYSLD